MLQRSPRAVVLGSLVSLSADAPQEAIKACGEKTIKAYPVRFNTGFLFKSRKENPL